MAQWHADPSGESGTLHFDGELTIEGVAAARRQLLDLFERAGAVTIDIASLKAIDVAGLQLLWACHQYAAERQYRLQILGGDNPLFRKMVEQAGLARVMACGADRDGDCLWSFVPGRNKA